jgi:hypothetical protein
MDEISFPSLFDTLPSTELSGVTPITPITFSLDGNTSGNSRDTPRQKPQTPEDDSGLEGFDADLEAQAAGTLSGDLGNDLSSLFKDLTSGNTSAAKADVSRIQADLQTQHDPSVADAQNRSPLDTLIGKISDSLNSDTSESTTQDGAQHDLANFLMENGHGTGNLLNTSG